MPEKEPVFLSESRRADRVLDFVIIELAGAMPQVSTERFPFIEQTRAGDAQLGLGFLQDPFLLEQSLGEFTHQLENFEAFLGRPAIA